MPFTLLPKILLGVILVLGAYTAYVKWQVYSSRADAAEARAALALEQGRCLLCQADNSRLEEKIANQNAAIREAEATAQALNRDARERSRKALSKPIQKAGIGAENMNRWLDSLR